MVQKNPSHALGSEAFPLRQLIVEIKSYLRAYRKQFLTGTFLAIFSSAIWLAIPWAFGEIISLSADYAEKGSVQILGYYLALIAIVSILYYASQELARYLIYLLANQASLDLQERTLRHMVELNLDWHEKENSGNKLKKINRGGNSLKDFLNLYINLGIDTVVSLVGITIIFFALDWRLNVILLAFFVIQYILGVYLTGRARSQARKVNKREEDFEGLKFELINNIRTVKTIGAGKALSQWIDQLTRQLIQEIRLRIVLFRTRLAVLGVNQQIFRLLIIAFAVWKVVEGEFAVGLIAQVYFYFGKVESTAKRFADMYHQLVLIRINLGGIFEILKEKADVENEGRFSFPSDWSSMHFGDIHFSYGKRKVLEGIDLRVERGQKIGIAGPSGAGKTSLFRLMQKLYKGYEGNILFDLYDLKEIRRNSYTPHLGVVLQETELFNMSVKDNVTLGHVANGEDDAWFRQVLYISGLHEFVEKLPKGWETRVGEKGVKLSGGEKQRIGIARALYRKPQLLFLDEATSQLDAELELQIQNRLRTYAKEMTVWVVAHRLASLQHMDKIVVIKNGRIHESGNYRSLLEKGGLFFSLWEKQKLEHRAQSL